MIFAHIDNEASVQVNDKTRIDGSKSYATQNDTLGLTALSVIAGSDSQAIDIFDTNVRERFLDWEFEFKVDIDSTNNKLDFKEAGVQFTATLTTATYTLAQLATEIATQLNATGNLSYTCTVDIDDKITISADDAFDLQLDGPFKNTVITRQLYFDPDQLTGKSSYTSERVESLSRKISLIAGVDQPQITTVTCLPNTAAALQNKYFFIWSNTGAKFHVWMNSDGAGTDPAPSGSTAIMVAITTGNTSTQVATAVASAVNATAQFNASSSLAIVTITGASDGVALPSVDFNSGFTITTTQYGQVSNTDISYISVYSVEGDGLFSDDSEIEVEEPEIRKYVKPGRNTYKDYHRQAQKKILEWLDRQGFVNIYEDKFTKNDIKDITEVREWSRYMVLRMIFEGIKNAVADVFQNKRDYYSAEEIAARNRARLRIDTDNDGTINDWEGINTNNTDLFFR